MDEERKSPNVFLEEANREERRYHRGKLKIFLGYAPGVGKTYAMLEAAHQMKSRGVDIVCGYIEPHARPDTIALIDDLECLNTMQTEYQGIKLRELNLDAVLKRHPQLVLIDEYAHTNAPSCRHSKRYQDIKEILAAGIDVFTTVNIQHIESLGDSVSSITGITVNERIPDYTFDEAENVELIDLEPRELLQRLRDGKVYAPDNAKIAISNFFTEEKLTALREIALRKTADWINLANERRSHPTDFVTNEHILVGISSSPSNKKIVRAAARLASAFHARLTAVFVETSRSEYMSKENRKMLQSNIHLARQFGARLETVYGDDIPFQIAEYAKRNRISKIVIGRSTTRHFFGRATFVERLVTLAPDLDVYIIPDAKVPLNIERQGNIKSKRRFRFYLYDILKIAAVFVAATGIALLFDYLSFSESSIVATYLLAVFVSAALVSGVVMNLISSALGVFLFNYFFTEPRFTFIVYDHGYIVTFAIMFAVALVTSLQMLRIKRSASLSSQAEYRTSILLEANRLIQVAKNLSDIFEIVSRQIISLVNRPVVFFYSNEGQLGDPLFFFPKEQEMLATIDEKEKATATWVLNNRKKAGASTNTLRDSAYLYYPFATSLHSYGVIGILLNAGEAIIGFEEELISLIISECAFAFERVLLLSKESEARQRIEIEKQRSNLLRAISHDLRTPLTTITGNAEILLNEKLDTKQHRILCEGIRDDSRWLFNIVENLLSITKIEDGMQSIVLQPELLEDLIDEAIKHVDPDLSKHRLIIKLENDLQFVCVDAQMIMQVIINIVDNAVKYTPEKSTITISSRKIEHMVEISIADDGEGIADQRKEHIFDMSHPNQLNDSDNRRKGLGLGLSICQSIIALHGGTITIKDNIPKGALFIFAVPADEVVVHE